MLDWPTQGHNKKYGAKPGQTWQNLAKLSQTAAQGPERRQMGVDSGKLRARKTLSNVVKQDKQGQIGATRAKGPSQLPG